MQLNWPALLADLSATPVEPIQLHYMRVGSPRGRIAQDFPEGWLPNEEKTAAGGPGRESAVLEDLPASGSGRDAADWTGDQWHCREELRQRTGGLSYAQMVELAEQSHFRKALWKIAESIADLFGEVAYLVPALRRMPCNDGPSWSELTKRWNVS